jgi:hypothetical protein
VERQTPQPEIQTFSGRRVNPFKPDPSQIVIADIAQALANQCRFGGHCRSFYSVAQHSCLLTDLVAAEGGDDTDQLWALLHDAAEAYLVDLPHPLKHRSELGERFRAVEEPLQRVILERFALPAQPSPRLKAIDRALLAAEKAALLSPSWEWPELEGVEAVGLDIEPWLSERAARELLARFAEINGRRSAGERGEP